MSLQNNTPKNTLTRWYVSPHNGDVNKRIALAMEGNSSCFNGDLSVKMIDGTTREVPVWEVPRYVINALSQDRTAKGRFTVFSQVNNGDIREFDPVKSRWLAFRRRGLAAKVPSLTKV